MKAGSFYVGQQESLSRTITEADVINYAGLSGDYNPIHVDAEYAKSTRFGQRIAHGLLTTSLLSNLLGMKLPGPGGVYLNQTLKFCRPVLIGDTITAKGEVIKVEESGVLTIATVCINQNQKIVLEGTAQMLVSA